MPGNRVMFRIETGKWSLPEETLPQRSRAEVELILASRGQKIGDLYTSNIVSVRGRIIGTRYYDVIETI